VAVDLHGLPPSLHHEHDVVRHLCFPVGHLARIQCAWISAFISEPPDFFAVTIAETLLRQFVHNGVEVAGALQFVER